MAEITGYSDMQIDFGALSLTISTKVYKIEKYEQKSLKYEFENQYDMQYLYKKGNRWYRDIVITQTHHTDDEFRGMAITLMKMCGRPVTLTPHTDEPSKTQLTWLTAFWDRYNKYPVERIVVQLEAVDID